jgi:hypothetical protein
MICPRCYGKHIEVVAGTGEPCPECGGLGEIHCCDGLQEQKDENHRAPESTKKAEEKRAD